MTRVLLLMRHGGSAANTVGAFEGWLDCPLTARGRTQAVDAGRLIRDTGPTPTASICRCSTGRSRPRESVQLPQTQTQTQTQTQRNRTLDEPGDSTDVTMALCRAGPAGTSRWSSAPDCSREGVVPTTLHRHRSPRMPVT
ncbi:histidine phosphatase family protein [Mycolicibacterium rutilum]|uniref:histidine phosphatase family protein n=1 Tax=Mycolicibacterium rutilum TaxID=370526 RepID=UPI0009F2911C